jgi:hypothetical protein
MSTRDFRAEQAQNEQAGRSDFAWMLGGALVAFLVGALVVFGWDRFPQLMQTMQTGSSQPRLDVASFNRFGPRLGEATMATMLRQCVPKTVLGPHADTEVDLPTLYKALHRAAGASRAQAMLGQKDAGDDQGIAAASLWSEVADCVYRQHGPAFCDRHNRAFAIEAANAFIRAYGAELAASASQNPDARSKDAGEILRLLDNRKDRVLDLLRARLRDGRLIADDFGYLTPPEIGALLRDVPPTRNLCAEERR